uniref:NADH-ubiquinone oxidoreductase chain 6 n=1 Tax=Chrysotimus molliculus TaxID=1000613 RepID=A0A7G7CDC7_9MUSC|nr:NADH dehydrogenase subunit 6 [Chrysotimus molliculus]
MFQLMINYFIISLSIIFMQMNHPLAMGLMLLVQTLLMCLASGIMSKTFWFSYILFLVFLGGMLVLFIYVTSLASNEMFSMSMNSIMFFMFIIIIMMLSIYMLDLNFINPFNENNEMNQLINHNSFIKENSLMLEKIYNYPTNYMTLILINYLLITLIAIVKITNIFYGPLRKMN